MADQQANFRASDVQVGDTIGTLLMLSTEMKARGRRQWDVRCIKCGMERSIRSDHLVRYVGTECHCAPHNKHGLSRIREYRILMKMIDRCHNPNVDNFRYYGAIGRYVCKGWRESPESFLTDMGAAPSDEHTIDRINTDGSYTCGHCDECREKQQPANCRWATKEVQHRNAKNNRYYTHDGKTLILKDWARLVGIDYHTVFCRINRGWSFEDAITVPKMTEWSRGRRGNGNGPQYKRPR